MITYSAMARGRLMSLVGAGRKSILLPMPSTSKRLQVKMKTNRVSASGTTLAPRGPMVSFTWPCTASTAISQASWNFPGTPLVSLARMIMPSRITTSPAITVAQMMSRSSVSPNTFVVTWSPTVMSMASDRK